MAAPAVYTEPMNRRCFLILLPATLACLVSCSCLGAAPALAESDVAVTFENGMYRGRFTYLVPVAPPIAWEVLTDFDHMAEFVPNLESSRILGRDADSITFAQKGRIKFGIFSFGFESERRVEMRPREGILLARALSGTAKHMASEMRLTSDSGGTRLDYRVEMIPGRWYPSSFGVSGMRHEMAEQFTAIAGEMLRRAEDRRSR